MLVLGIVDYDLFLFHFHGLQALAEYIIRHTILSFHEDLTIMVLLSCVLINIPDVICQLSQKCL